MSSSLAVLAFGVLGFVKSQWNYKNEGPDRWYLTYPACDGSDQSPRNIPTILPDECINDNLLTLDWNHATSNLDWIVRNNGHTMVLTPVAIDDNTKTLDYLNKNHNRIASLNNIWSNTYTSSDNKRYCLDSLHFHWGPDGSVGSEHTFDNKYSAFEAHFLHYSCDYESLGDALKAYVNGQNKDDYILSAVGILFDVGEPNAAIENIVNPTIIDEVYPIGGKDANNHNKISHVFTEFSINDFLPENKELVTYLGAITAPPCFETVRWNVLTHKLTISQEQLAQFRKLLESNDENDKLVSNYRPLQNNTNPILYCESQMNALRVEDEKETHTMAILIIAGSVVFFFMCIIGICQYNKKRKEKGFPSLLSLSSQAQDNEYNMEQITSKDQYACYQ